MHSPLSYPALKLVLEYVELEKRIHLTSRSSFLQRIDNAIPVRAKKFCINGDYLSLDKFIFAVEHKGWYNTEEIKKNGKLLMSYLKGRSSVNVDSAYFSVIKTSQNIPVKLELTVNKLRTFCSNPEVWLPMINPRSFPLTDLTMIIDKPADVDLEIVRSAKDVSFLTYHELIGLEKIPNKKVYLRLRPINVVVRIIKYWMQNGKEVGTEFSMPCSRRSDLVQMLNALQAEFQKTRGYSEDINKHLFSGFSIPLNSTSQLFVYGIGKRVDKLVLKVV